MNETPQAVKEPTTARLPFQRSKRLEQNIADVNEEILRRNQELAETNKTLSLLRNIDALVLESHASLKMVCTHITEAITQATDFPFVGLFTRAAQSGNEMRLYGWSGRDWLGAEMPLGVSRPIHIRSSDSWLTEEQTSRTIALGDNPAQIITDLLDCSREEIQAVLDQTPLQSLHSVKLLVRRRVVGVLVVGFSEPVAKIKPADLTLLDHLSDSIGVALDNKLLFEENRHVLKQLRDSNAKLLALDAAKDEFVSMASHQLRTPLTAVKGYLSMVIEGDAGEINDAQRKLLNQSFYSSQRMVYLIADLLNVSRLKTGKFVIESKPVNLAEVVGDELSQLKEAAAIRSLEFIYEKPAEFPTLMLDEIKIRQLVMNFADNALYYTPAGGTITVQLIDKPSTIELRVIDTGMGVPRTEQPHLFTKFYRAGNARKARPDGTGLGLFMAKKVIIAQGGSLIFESKEGEGSTFGFVFSKKKLAVPQKTTENS